MTKLTQKTDLTNPHIWWNMFFVYMEVGIDESSVLIN